MKKLIRITTIPLSLDKLIGKQLEFMNQFYDVTAVAADEKQLERVAKKYGVKHHHVEMTRTISPLKDFKALVDLYRFLKVEKPEIVHSHTPKAGIVGMMAAYLAGVPNRLHTVAGLPLLEATGAKRKLLNFVEKLTYRFATKVYPNSFGLKAIILKEKFCSEEKLHVIGNGSSNGIDTDFFSRDKISAELQENLKSELGIKSEDYVFLFVGRLVKDKGIEELVTAFTKLNTSYKNIKLLLVGPFEHELDPLSQEILSLIEKNENCISVGYKDDVRPYFAISNCLTFPSYREGFPNVVLQAGAMELCSIVSDINGCNEIITDKHNGRIVPVKNSDLLYEAMNDVLSSKELSDQYAQIACSEIRKKYDQKQIWNDIKFEYEKLN